MTSNHMISSVILQCWCRFLFSSSLGTSERSHPQQQKPTHKAVGKIHEGMASNRSQLSQLSQWKLGNINGFQWIYDNCSIKPSKKKSPMITMGLALSDPMGCYRFKPRYPVVQSKIAVFFWMFIFQNISEYGISGVDKCWLIPYWFLGTTEPSARAFSPHCLHGLSVLGLSMPGWGPKSSSRDSAITG